MVMHQPDEQMMYSDGSSLLIWARDTAEERLQQLRDYLRHRAAALIVNLRSEREILEGLGIDVPKWMDVVKRDLGDAEKAALLLELMEMAGVA